MKHFVLQCLHAVAYTIYIQTGRDEESDIIIGTYETGIRKTWRSARPPVPYIIPGVLTELQARSVLRLTY